MKHQGGRVGTGNNDSFPIFCLSFQSLKQAQLILTISVWTLQWEQILDQYCVIEVITTSPGHCPHLGHIQYQSYWKQKHMVTCSCPKAGLCHHVTSLLLHLSVSLMSSPLSACGKYQSLTMRVCSCFTCLHCCKSTLLHYGEQRSESYGTKKEHTCRCP